MFTSFLFLLGALMSNAIKTPSFFRKLTDMKLLAVVNKLNNRKGLPEMSQVLAVDEARNSATDHFREAMRKLRFGLESSGKRKILFTSLKPNTGKTTTILALAHTMKLSRKRVLLIDTNFSHNSLSQVYGVQAYLEDSAKMHPQADHVRKLISKTDDPFIDIIGCRGGSYTPSEILPHQNLLGHLDELLPEYDHIILEGPALDEHADSQELIRYVDGVVAVFSADEQITPSDNTLMQYLEDLDQKLVGAVLNDVDLKDVDA
jgi:Mrp family chromosome partitioning ATPase